MMCARFTFQRSLPLTSTVSWMDTPTLELRHVTRRSVLPPQIFSFWQYCSLWNLLDIRAFLGFERWQSAHKGFPLGSVTYHLGSIGGVEASRMEVVLDGISPSSFWGTSWSFPAMNVWVEVIDPSYREDGMRKRCPNQSRRRCRRRYDAVGCLMRSRMLRLLMCCCQNARRRHLWQRMLSTSMRRRSARVVDHASEP